MKFTEDQRLQDIAALSVVALALAGVGVFRLLTVGGAGTTAASDAPAQVLGEQFERPTTTAARAAATPTAARPSPTSPPTTVKLQKSPPPTRLITVTSVVDCAHGGATAAVALSTIKNSDSAQYVSDAAVTATSSLDRPLQIDKLVVRVKYDDGTSDAVPVGANPAGTLGPGDHDVLHANLTTSKQPVAASIDTFEYHVAGDQRCSGHTP